MTDVALYYYHHGVNFKAYELYGAHPAKQNGKSGYVFRVWAPRAAEVILMLNGGDAGRMTRMEDGESFELVSACAREGDLYNFRIITFEGRELVKCDPYAFRSALPAHRSSVVYDLPPKNKRLECGKLIDKPVNIFEVNLLSWKRHGDGS